VCHRRGHGDTRFGSPRRIVPRATRGWDAAKQVNGRKRHIAVDTAGLVLAVVITAASVQDRDAARPLLWTLHWACPRVRLVWADAGYTAGKLAAWAAALAMSVSIVARCDPHAFEILPRRWVVERTFAWISKHRRTVRDYEHLTASHEAMILWAMIALMARRLAQPTHLSTLTKHDLQARPIYYDRPIDYDRRDSIEVHLLIVFASLAVSCWIEEATSWRMRKFVRTGTSLPDDQARRRRTRPYPAMSTTPRPHPPRSSAH
jgi:transposase